jgi:hypothetical protein
MHIYIATQLRINLRQASLRKYEIRREIWRGNLCDSVTKAK